MELQRYGRGPEGFPYILTALSDGYWTPWHVADAERMRLQKMAEQQRPDAESVVGKAQTDQGRRGGSHRIGHGPVT